MFYNQFFGLNYYNHKFIHFYFFLFLCLRNFVIFYIIFPDLAIGLFSYVDSVGPVHFVSIY